MNAEEIKVTRFVIAAIYIIAILILLFTVGFWALMGITLFILAYRLHDSLKKSIRIAPDNDTDS